MKNNGRVFLSIATVLVLFFTGCSAKKEWEYDAVPPMSPSSGMSQAADAPEMSGIAYDTVDEIADMPSSDTVEINYNPLTAGSDEAVEDAPPEPQNFERKIVRNVSVELQTNSFDDGVQQLQQIATGYGGYIQDSYVQGKSMYGDYSARQASFTMRIPAHRLDEFMSQMDGSFHVVNTYQSSDDISDSYFDSKAHLNALEIQEQRLLELLSQSSDLKYLLQVERERASVRYQIERLTAAIKRMDQDVSLSTVSVQLDEVMEYSSVKDLPVSFGVRVQNAFSDSMKNLVGASQAFVLWVVFHLPGIVFWAVLVVIAVVLFRRKLLPAIRLGRRSTQPSADPEHRSQDDAAPPSDEGSGV